MKDQLPTVAFDCDRTCPLFELIDTCRFRPVLDELGPVKVNSHVVDVKIEFRDMDAMSEACDELGLDLQRGRTDYKWYGHHVGDYPLPEGFSADDLGKCDHAIHRKDGTGYGAGLARRGDHYRLLFDFWGRNGRLLTDAIGENAEKLTAAYSEKVVIKKARQLGWKTQKTAKGVTIFHPKKGRITVAGGKLEGHGFNGRGCHEAILEFEKELGQTTRKQKKQEYNRTEVKVRQK